MQQKTKKNKKDIKSTECIKRILDGMQLKANLKNPSLERFCSVPLSTIYSRWLSVYDDPFSKLKSRKCLFIILEDQTCSNLLLLFAASKTKNVQEKWPFHLILFVKQSQAAVFPGTELFLPIRFVSNSNLIVCVMCGEEMASVL